MFLIVFALDFWPRRVGLSDARYFLLFFKFIDLKFTICTIMSDLKNF